MIGALRKVWPWKEVLESSVIRGKIHVLREQNVLPDQLGQDVFIAVGLVLTGAAIVLVLERFSRGRK